MSRPNATEVVQALRGAWLAEGEQLSMIAPPAPGHVAATIGEAVRVPHETVGPVPETKLSPPEWPLPCELTVTGQLPGDEWISDPTVTLWAAAGDATLDAIRLADHVVAGRGETGLALTDRRLAVVIPERFLGPAPTKPKGLFGGKSMVFSDFPYWIATDMVVSLFEIEAGRIRGVHQRLAGRDLPPRKLTVVDFQDGSQIRVRGLMNIV